MRVGLVSCNGQARDAIGNNLAEKLLFFTERGADVRVFLQSDDRLHPGLAGHAYVVDVASTTGPAWDYLKNADLIIVDLAHDYPLLQFLPLLAGGKPRLILEYHGITPPHLFAGPQRVSLERALARRGLAWCADFVLVHSRFIGAELARATGFPSERLLQLDFPMDERLHPGQTRWSMRAHLGLGNARVLLFVGRLAANKRVPILIEALARLGDIDARGVILGDNTDVYGEEERRCRDLARRLGVEGRLHFLGAVEDERLAECYRESDVLVMPSQHEGFCVPVLEAQASGVPVVSARAAALPETVGDAGLTFAPDDIIDLERQLRRVLAPSAANAVSRPGQSGRIAIVCFRYGPDIVGGAETSLRKIARALKNYGQQVEVFTTCTRAESMWRNELPAGTFSLDGIPVHRYPIDAHDRPRHLESFRRIVEGGGQPAAEVEEAYLRHSVHSESLIAGLRDRHVDFDAIIVGPYLFGLTHDIAIAFPDKTLLLSCFHEEPLAHLKMWAKAYGQVGGILYHSPEERELAQSVLGINNPGCAEIGTYLEPGECRADHASAALDKRYLVYCGRYSRQKELPRLLDYAARYEAARPGRFLFAFMGEGEVAIGAERWASELGHVDEPVKRAMLAGADALVQLSTKESLSLVALEAWAEGTPVVISKDCAVLAGQVRRSAGGQAVGDYTEFARALDDLWDRPEEWRRRGQSGRVYVQENYSSESAFAERVLRAVADLQVPVAERMRRRGLARAAQSSRAAWRQRFGAITEKVLDSAPRPYRLSVVVTPLRARFQARIGARSLLVPVRIDHHGTHALAADGPAHIVLCCQVGDGPVTPTSLPGLLLPGKSQTMAARVSVPSQPGEHFMYLWIDRADGTEVAPATPSAQVAVGGTADEGCTALFLEASREALLEVEARRNLPDDYIDVTQGWFARWKLWLKGKLLGNFKRGYVDILSRQQSDVNRSILASLQQLTECCATLDHALRGLHDRIDKLETRLAQEEPASSSTL